LMCGDIIYMWNVKSVINNLNKNTLTKSVVLLIVKRKLDPYQLENTKIVKRAKSLLIGGMKAMLEMIVKRDTEVNQRPKHFRLKEQLDITIDTQIKRNKMKSLTHIEGVVITLDTLIGKLLKNFQMFALSVGVQKI